MVRTGFATSVETRNCYPPAWVQLYTEQGFMLYDPVLRWAYENIGSCRWSEIPLNDPREILSAAAEYGLKYGAVVSYRRDEKDSKRTIASFARSDRELSGSEITFLAGYIRDAHEKSSPRLSVTKKELEVLGLLKEGYLIKEIAIYLGVSESAVKQRLNNLKSKLSAKTTPQAVAILSEHGLL